MCEDEDKTVPTVIKKRYARGSKSKGLRNLKTPSGKAKTSTESKTRGGSDDHPANSIRGAVTKEEGGRGLEESPDLGHALSLTLHYRDSAAGVH